MKNAGFLGTDIEEVCPRGIPAFYFALYWAINKAGQTSLMSVPRGVFMKKFNYILAMLALVLVFGLVFVGCGSPEDPGTLTVKDLPTAFNGKYAIFVTDHPSNPSLVGYESVVSGRIMLPQISNGTVTIPIWHGWGGGSEKYAGNDTYVTDWNNTQGMMRVMVKIYDTPSIQSLNETGFAYFFYASLKFANGIATISYNDRMPD